MTHPVSPSHLDDEILIRLQDGELPPADRKRAQAHLRQCWSCRYRADEINRTVLNLVGLCDRALEGVEAVGGWRRFESRLARQVLEVPPPRLPLPAWAPMLLMSAAAAAVVIWWLVATPNVQTVHASELLSRSSAVRERAWRNAAGAVIHQRLEIHADTGPAAGWDVWHAENRTGHRWSGSDSLRRQTLAAYGKAGFNVEQPLSPAAYQRSGTLSEEVERDTGRGEVTVRTRTGPASLTLRESDLHPVAQSVGALLIRETAFEIIPPEQVPPGVFEPIESARIFTRTAPAEIPAPESTLDPEVAEAQLRLALHELQMDTRFSPEIEGHPSGVALRLIVESERERTTLLQRLRSIQSVTAIVTTPDEPSPLRSRGSEAAVESTPVRLERTEPPLARRLVDLSGSNEAAQSYIGRVHAAWRGALAPAIGLQQLAQRYPPGLYAGLPEEAKAAVDTIAVSFLTNATAGSAEFSRSLDLGIRATGLRHEPTGAIAVGVPWQATADLLVARLRSLDAAFNRLFVTHEQAVVEGKATYEPSDLAELRCDLDSLLARMRKD